MIADDFAGHARIADALDLRIVGERMLLLPLWEEVGRRGERGYEGCLWIGSTQ